MPQGFVARPIRLVDRYVTTDGREFGTIGLAAEHQTKLDVREFINANFRADDAYDMLSCIIANVDVVLPALARLSKNYTISNKCTIKESTHD